jgi:lipoprotein-anchoring transpeptidase ErfK/SrfK
MYFFEDYAIHGTYWHSTFSTPMSHGCVNVSTPDAGWLFDAGARSGRWSTFEY